jgi:hypothetical protein
MWRDLIVNIILLGIAGALLIWHWRGSSSK